MKAITLCAWRRPKYLKMVLDALSKCSGIEDYILYIGIDGGGGDETIAVARSVKFVPAEILINTRHIGCNLNTKHVLMYAFQHFDYVVHFEDDTLPALDALKFYEWARQFGSDPRVFTAAGWGLLPKGESKPDDNARAVLHSHFSSWGWATWRNRWLEMQAGWSSNDDMNDSWDFKLDKVRNGRCAIQPRVSRITNIGAELGTHRGDCLLSDWAGSPGFKPPEKFIAEWLA